MNINTCTPWILNCGENSSHLCSDHHESRETTQWNVSRWLQLPWKLECKPLTFQLFAVEKNSSHLPNIMKTILPHQAFNMSNERPTNKNPFSTIILQHVKHWSPNIKKLPVERNCFSKNWFPNKNLSKKKPKKCFPTQHKWSSQQLIPKKKTALAPTKAANSLSRVWASPAFTVMFLVPWRFQQFRSWSHKKNKLGWWDFLLTIWYKPDDFYPGLEKKHRGTFRCGPRRWC